MKTLLPMLMIFFLSVLSCPTFVRQAMGEDTSGSDSKQAANTKQAADSKSSAENSRTFLGVGIEPLHPALVSQLLDLIGEGRGVLVTGVAPNSPAEKAGLKQDDILVSYDDQKLYAPEQLMQLVRHDKPGREVMLGVVRGGKSQKIKATLGEQEETVMEHPRRASHWPWRERSSRPGANEERESRWQSFDSMTISRVDADHFKAEIKYRDDKGKIETHAFQGTRDELRKDINAERDLPANERDHLLRSLGLINHPFEIDFPAGPFGPGGVWWDSEDFNRY